MVWFHRLYVRGKASTKSGIVFFKPPMVILIILVSFSFPDFLIVIYQCV